MPNVNLEDTIVAIATATGVGAIGIVRLSGREALEIASKMFQAAKSGMKLTKVKSHTVHFGVAIDQKGNTIDEVLVSVFLKPHSYTAENVIEISAHGGPKILQKILERAMSLGARQAEPGEFTRRAFLNGRMDLTQAEAVCDLISAKSERAIQVATRQLEGHLSAEVGQLKDKLMKLYAHLEAYLDFPDEHLEVYSNREFQKHFEEVETNIRRLMESFSKGQILREGALSVIVGRPNVGKSSLLNSLLERDRAIVSDVPGTTRDVLEESIVIDGQWIRLVDTAGLQKSSDALERAAMERTKRYINEADLFLWVLDGSEILTSTDEEIAAQISGKKTIIVINKKDLPQRIDYKKLETLISSSRLISISAKSGDGINLLEKEIASLVVEADLNSESNVITHERHRRALESALESLKKSKQTFIAKESLEYVTLDLKSALDQLRELVGEIYSEDLLDIIFREFCIGK